MYEAKLDASAHSMEDIKYDCTRSSSVLQPSWFLFYPNLYKNLLTPFSSSLPCLPHTPFLNLNFPFARHSLSLFFSPFCQSLFLWASVSSCLSSSFSSARRLPFSFSPYRTPVTFHPPPCSTLLFLYPVSHPLMISSKTRFHKVRRVLVMPGHF